MLVQCVVDSVPIVREMKMHVHQHVMVEKPLWMEIDSQTHTQLTARAASELILFLETVHVSLKEIL